MTCLDESGRPVSRRAFLATSGALVVTLTAAGEWIEPAVAQADGGPKLAPDQLDSWIAINPDGSATAFFGKIDCAQGTDVGIRQIVAEELDLPYERVAVVMGDPQRTVNQGGASGSTGVKKGGATLRNAAAEARRILVELASRKLGVPVDQLSVVDGLISAISDASKAVSYADLIGGRNFDTPIEWNKVLGNDLIVKVKAKPKPWKDYKVVGRPRPRTDLPAKVHGEYVYVTDVRVPGMVHARMIRPPIAGAVPVSVDESSINDIPGAQIVRVENLIGVVAPKEWDAVRASRAIKVTWSHAKPPFSDHERIYDHIRKAVVNKRQIETERGHVDDLFAKAQAAGLRVIEAEYEWPFQSHASMGPACAIVDAGPDRATVWTGTQKPHYCRDGVAAILGLAPGQVTGHWLMGPGSYGRNDAGDAAMDAAVLSKAVGKPVRVQYMRHEGTGWDPKTPASVHRGRAAIDSEGRIVAYEFMSKGFSRLEIFSNESYPGDTLAGQLLGFPRRPREAFAIPGESYVFENKRTGWETIAALLDAGSPLRTSHMRDPAGPQTHFASEQFIDELAAATRSDPVEFRLRYLADPRDIGVLKAAAEKARWTARPAPRTDQDAVDVLHGQGIAVASHSETTVAIVAKITIDRRTGQITPIRYVVAHDCGLVINPQALLRTIEGNCIQAASRSLWEEVKFDQNSVTSVDWDGYPISDITVAPAEIEIVVIEDKNMPALGAAEGATRPMAAALANAVFDATGVRIRRAPLTAERVKAALNGA
jgi:CO/xanthine dehydrogenase Mo-binding subunit